MLGTSLKQTWHDLDSGDSGLLRKYVDGSIIVYDHYRMRRYVCENTYIHTYMYE